MAKPKFIVIYRKRETFIRAVILPPGSSTRKHLEKEDYVVVPLTNGAMEVEIFDAARQVKPTEVQVINLRPGRKYRRTVGGGKYIRATNKAHNPPPNKNTIIIVKVTGG